MRKTTLISVIVYIVISFSSCIKSDEPLYKEADIEFFSLDDDIMINAVISQRSILVIVSDTSGIGRRKFRPQIEVSPGAILHPSPDDELQFTNYLAAYKVVSQDGSLTKLYTIEVVEVQPLVFDFEDWKHESLGLKKYPVLSDPLWANANAGLAIAVPSNYAYPTRPTPDSYKGDYAALLETKEGVKVLGLGANIVAGSLFRGRFEVTTPVSESAKFGQVFSKLAGKPKRLKGYYKYSPGPEYVDKNNTIIDKVDQCAIYAVMFKVSKGSEGLGEYLTSSNVATSSNVIARATLADGTEKPEYTAFELDFIYSDQPDYDSYDYKLAIVFSSSKDGDLEQGAVGSVLIVDEVEVEVEYYTFRKER